MKKSNIVLGLACGFFLVALLSFYIDISVQVITTLSISSLLFSIAQAIQGFLSEKKNEHKAMLEAFDQVANMNITKDWMLFYKKYVPELNAGKKEKMLKIISTIIECTSIVVLVCGLVIPLPIFENQKIGTFCTVSSFSAIFLSIWLTTIIHNKLQMWDDIILFSMLFNRGENTNCISEDTDNG